MSLIVDFTIEKRKERESPQFRMITQLMENAIIKFPLYIRLPVKYRQLTGHVFATHLTPGNLNSFYLQL